MTINKPATRAQVAAIPAGVMISPKYPNRKARRRAISARRSAPWYGVHVKRWQLVPRDELKKAFKLIGHLK